MNPGLSDSKTLILSSTFACVGVSLQLVCEMLLLCCVRGLFGLWWLLVFGLVWLVFCFVLFFGIFHLCAAGPHKYLPLTWVRQRAGEGHAGQRFQMSVRVALGGECQGWV